MCQSILPVSLEFEENCVALMSL